MSRKVGHYLSLGALAFMLVTWALLLRPASLGGPVTYLIVGALKRAEHEDYYDRDTRFTPFSLKA